MYYELCLLFFLSTCICKRHGRGEKGGDSLAHLAISSHLLIKAHLEFALDTHDTAYGTAQSRMSRNNRIGKYGVHFVQFSYHLC